MSNIPLIVTPGWNFAEEVPVTAAALNAAATPQVTFPDGPFLTADNLDMASLTPALVEAARNTNFAINGSFWPENWITQDALTVPKATIMQNAQNWFCRATGADVIYMRAQESPSILTSYCARIFGNTALTLTEFYTYLSPNYTGELANVSMVFSCYVYNATGASLRPTFILRTSNGFADKENVTERISQQAPAGQAIAPNTWGRCEWAFSTAHTDWIYGAQIGITIGSQMDSTAKYIQMAQVQIELGTVATAFQRAQQPPAALVTETLPTEFGGTDKLTGGWLPVFLKNTKTLRYLGAPPAFFLQPYLSWNKLGGYPEWREMASRIRAYTYSGLMITVEVPAGATLMKVYAWGAGGSADAIWASVILHGGCGGFTWGEFPVTASGGLINEGDKLTGFVGYGQHGILGQAYGYGGFGQGAAHQAGGGGMTGLFLGDAYVEATDFARALVVAGGGGAGGQSGGGANGVQGGNGNEPGRSGGMPTFQANDGNGGVNFGTGGGGGGYSGGAGFGLGGLGGTGFLHAGKSAGEIKYATYPSIAVPGSDHAIYDGTWGQEGTPGLLVVDFA